jgi:hypothetical protein
MTTPVISGDGIFSHVFIGAADVEILRILRCRPGHAWYQ